MSASQEPPADAVPFTRLLERAVRGEDDAVQHVLPRVDHELVAIARSAMRKERGDHPLQATALVHECWMKLLGEHSPSFESRAEFYRAAAEAMRRILVDHARRRARIKRGGGRERVPITTAEPAISDDPEKFLALDEAIQRLQDSDPRAAEIVRLRFFAGLGVDETADAIGLSRRTVLREWAYARALLYRELTGEAPPTTPG